MTELRTPLGFSLPDGWQIKKTHDRAYVYITDGKREREISSGCTISDYELLELIGEGGSCLCYKAINLVTGKVVIIKEQYPYDFAARGLIIRSGADILPAEGISANERDEVTKAYAEGFTQEITAAESNQYRVTDQGGVNNDPYYFASYPINWPERVISGALNQDYLVIETHSGACLKDIQLQGVGKDRVLECLGLAKRILEQVGYLHKEKHRLHLDISPSNLFVSQLKVGTQEDYSKNIVLLIDFGSSFEIDSSGKVVHSGALYSASPKYMAPELANRDIDRIGPQTDLFSVGKVLQELLVRDSTKPARSWRATALHDPHISVLPAPMSEYLVDTIASLTTTRRPFSVNEMISILSEIEDVLIERGISPVLMKYRAQQKAESLKKQIEIDDDLLCKVERVT